MQTLDDAAQQTHGRIHQLLTQLPLGILLLILCNISIYLSTSLFDININDYSLCSLPIEPPYYQFYRIFTNSYLHVSVIHLLMNMAYIYTMGAMIEKQLGTIAILCQQVLFTVVIAFVYILLTHITILLTQNPNYSLNCGVGYSGIIFTYCVIDVVLRPEGQRSIFGFFSVPSYLYPLTLLLLISILIPNVSWLGHLSGIITGWLYCRGILRPITLPRNVVYYIENHYMPSFIQSLPNYTKYPEHDYLAYAYFNIINTTDIYELYDNLITRYNQWRDQRRINSLASGNYAQLDNNDIDSESQQTVVPSTTNNNNTLRPTTFTVGPIHGERPRQATKSSISPLPTNITASQSVQPSAPSYQQSFTHTSADTIDPEEEALRLALQRSINDT